MARGCYEGVRGGNLHHGAHVEEALLLPRQLPKVVAPVDAHLVRARVRVRVRREGAGVGGVGVGGVG